MKCAELVAVAAVLAATGAFAQDAGDLDCPLNPDVASAPFKAKLPKSMKLLETVSEPRVVTQRVQMPDGSIATVTIGGCAHLGFSVQVERSDLGPNLRKGVTAVTASLRALPLNEYPRQLAGQLLEALGKAKVSKSPADLPCGDAQCRFELTPGVALISYVFIL